MLMEDNLCNKLVEMRKGLTHLIYLVGSLNIGIKFDRIGNCFNIQ